jgi:PAS domain S-box-containing protein
MEPRRREQREHVSSAGSATRGQAGEPASNAAGAAADLERALSRLEHQYEISKLFARFENLEQTFDEALGIITKTLPLRSAILIERDRDRSRMLVWPSQGSDSEQMRAAKTHVHEAYAYLVGAGPQALDVAEQVGMSVLPWQRTPHGESSARKKFIVIPLVVGHHGIFGALQLEAASSLERRDLVFANAVANQLAIALDRHRAWQRDIARREVAETGRARAEASEIAAEEKRAGAEVKALVTQQKLHTAESLTERYEALIDNLDHAFVWEAHARTVQIFYVSARVEKLLGYSRQQWLDRADSWMTHVHPGDRDEVRGILKRALDERRDQRCDHRCVAVDGREVWFHTGVHLADADTDAPWFQGVSVDITAAKHAEDRLREQLAFIRSLAGSLGEGVVAVDLEHRATFVNQATEDLLGWREADLLGMPFCVMTRILTPEGTVARCPLERVLQTGEADRSDEYLFARRDGTAFPVSYSSAPIRRSGALVGAIFVFQDITERKRIEAALVEAIRAREQVLAIVSHDLRSPLSVIRISTAILLEDMPPDNVSQGQRRKLLAIERSALRMGRLIDDLMDLASIQAGRLAIEPQLEAPGLLVQEAVTSFETIAQEKQLDLRAAIAETMAFIRCDRDRVLQVFSNLVGNAVKVTAAGGSITLRVEERDSQALFSVSDTGPGIPRDQLDRIFECYWRGEDPGYQGSGLGLAIARGIVHAHGGRIWAESTVGVGSTFFFTIPTADSPTPQLDSSHGGHGPS